jgi:hypothetical protein
MYGLVNRAVEDLALQLGGSALWSRIKERSGVDFDVFVDMVSYPDEVTYRLVAAASEALDIPAAAVLEAFGRHWVLYTGRAGYGDLFETMGRNLPEFLGNLDSMHARLSLSMPVLRPPSFVCEPLDADRLRLEYWSERDGLAPMVTGLLTGLGELFDVAVSVTHTLRKEAGADHDEFIVVHPPAGAASGRAAWPRTS